MTYAPDRGGLGDLRFCVLGAGRVGSSLAHWLASRGARLQWVASRSETSARALADALGGSIESASRASSAGADLLLIAIPDSVLDSSARELAARPQALAALHVSGSRSAGALEPLRAQGTHCGAFHPLMAFPGVRTDVLEARDLVFGIDGDPPALALGERSAAAWGARTVTVPPQARLLYHYAATLAAGGVVTLAALAEEIAERLGLPAELGGGYRRLAATALEGVGEGRAAGAITGPTARGDQALVTSELDAAAALLPESSALANDLALETLRQIGRIGTLTPAQKALRERLLARSRG